MPKIVDHAALKRELLDRVTPLFLQYGYESVTTRQLARHLGISTGKLYHYFGSKELLFEALVLHWQDEDIRCVRECSLEQPDRESRIRTVLHGMMQDRERILTTLHLILQYCQLQRQKGISLVEFWRAFHQRWEEVIQDVFEFESAFACQMFGMVVDSLFLSWLTDFHHPDFAEVVERLACWLPAIDRGESAKPR